MTHQTQPIWLDITTLVLWQRPAVGIIRVEQQLALWLTQHQQSNIRYCRYERHTQRFFQIETEAVKQHLQRIAAYDTAANPGGPAARGDLHLRLVRRARAILGHLPPAISVRLTNFLVRHKTRILGTLNRLEMLAQRLKPRLPTRSPAPQQPTGPNPFGVEFELPAGAVYISLGLDWDYKDMAHLYRLKREKGLKYLFFCYDIIPIRLPHLCVADVSRQFAHYFADLAWAADLVLCISESSRRDLATFLPRLGVPCPTLKVIHLGSDTLPQGKPSAGLTASIAQLIGQPYVLFVSTIERRKNHEILYRAYTRLLDEGVKVPSLVFVGMPGWGVGDFLADLRLDPRVQGRIHILNHVSDAELATLYQHASFTVYPSLYEGWGLPVAESLAFGKFCLCANTSSLPEVGGDWVEYLDPWDLPAWTERLRHYILHPEEIAARNARIAAGYCSRPWSTTAQEIYDHACRLQNVDSSPDSALDRCPRKQIQGDVIFAP